MVTSKIQTHGFQKGNTLGSLANRKGSKNKITMDIRDKFYHVYDDMGKIDKVTGDEAFLKWARLNKKTFYTLFAKLAPTNLNIHDGREHESFIDRMTQQILEANATQIDTLDTLNNKDTMTIDHSDTSQVVDTKGVNLDLVVSPSIVKS